ncbi:hypothetical protein JKP88DRAFT_281536 [Tribonema minus]|uniref:Uncharacterized protein n=1 Tax=Tribonema minus TaxID=303371 RepID=A0A835YM44_9STRA|nr:hypothetical protein JKP88DRAFT_281536 [Tribonema minus]
MEAARSEDVRASARSRSEAEGDGPRHTVLANPQLLASIMTFTGYGQWLYLASVAPSWRTAYMSVTARRQGVPWVCVTSVPAAAESLARLETALACGLEAPLFFADAVPAAIGASGSLEVIRRAQQLRLMSLSNVVTGAIGARHTDILYMVPTLALEGGTQVTFLMWARLAAHLFCTAADDDKRKAALVWLSQQSLGAQFSVTPAQMEWLRSVGGSWSRETLSNALKRLNGLDSVG